MNGKEREKKQAQIYDISFQEGITAALNVIPWLDYYSHFQLCSDGWTYHCISGFYTSKGLFGNQESGLA